MSFPHEDGPSALLLPNSLTAHEGLSRDFHYEVEPLSDNAHIALKDLQGKMVTLEILRNDRSPRYFNRAGAERIAKNRGNKVGC